MKKLAALFVFTLGFTLVLTVPAKASEILYDNTTDSSYTDYGYYVGDGEFATDSFNLSADSTVTGISLGVELIQGGLDPVTEVDWQITTSPFGGDQIDSGVATSFTEYDSAPSFSGGDGGLPTFAQIYFDIDDPDLTAGVYYLEIDYLAGTLNGEYSEVDWDVSGGDSTAFLTYDGSVASNTFQILGTEDSATPEPSSILLLGSGLAGLAGLLKRKLAA